MKKYNQEAMFGIRKGVAFYFNDYIDKEKIKQIVKIFSHMTGNQFTRKRANDDPKIRLIRGGWEKVFDNTFKDSSFDNANVLTFTDGTKDTLQTTQIYMTLWNPNLLPSCIVANCSTEISWNNLFSFLQEVSKLIPLQFASAGYDVVSNDFLYPGSAAYSLKYLQTVKYANSEWTEWIDGFKLKANQGIPNANLFQFLSRTLLDQINEDELTKHDHVFVTESEGGSILDILDRENGELVEPQMDILLSRLSELTQILRPIIVFYDKPLLWKGDDSWKAWRNRFG